MSKNHDWRIRKARNSKKRTHYGLFLETMLGERLWKTGMLRLAKKARVEPSKLGDWIFSNKMPERQQHNQVIHRLFTDESIKKIATYIYEQEAGDD